VRVLLVEDDRSIAESLVSQLEGERYEVSWVTNGADALAHGGDVDLVLLDLGLPDMDGLDVCRELRRTTEAPIIMLTARDSETDRVIGLELGADDYIGKPFGFRELHARIRAVLRRVRSVGAAGEADAEDELRAGELTVNRRTREVRVAGRAVELTPREYDLLVYLAHEPGTVHTRQRILEEVWDANWFGPTKTLDVHVAALRKKLDDPELIETVRGVGFRLQAR
jgi:two-component system, OmpR family, response regulator RegX3